MAITFYKEQEFLISEHIDILYDFLLKQNYSVVAIARKNVSTSISLIKCINYFHKLGGFDSMYERIVDDKREL